MMSPRLALCEAGWRESSRGGFRRAGLARCEAGWTVSRWARIAQARPGPGPVIPLSGPGITQARPGPRRSGAGVRLRRSGSRGGRRARTQDVLAPARGRSGCRARHRGPDPDPRPGSSRPGPRDRHLTREHVPLADVLAGQVTISAVTRRSRGLSDVLAARAVPRRGGQVSWCGVLSVRWWWRAVPAAPPLLRPAVPRPHRRPLSSLPVRKTQCRSLEIPRTSAE